MGANNSRNNYNDRINELERNLNVEKQNGRIHNNELYKLDRQHKNLIIKYKNDIRDNTNYVNYLTDRNNDIIIRKDNMKNILSNNVSAIEPDNYSKTMIIENFDEKCPYTGTSSSSTGSASNYSDTTPKPVSESEPGIIYDPIPYYTIDLQNRKDDVVKNSKGNFNNKYKYILDQNNVLLERLQYINNQFTRHNNKFDFYSNNTSKLSFFNNILFYLYFILIFIAFFKLFFNTPDWSIYYKILIIVVLIAFPLVVYTIETLIYNTWLFSYSFLSGNVYNNMSYSNKVVLNVTTDLTTKE